MSCISKTKRFAPFLGTGGGLVFNDLSFIFFLALLLCHITLGLDDGDL